MNKVFIVTRGVYDDYCIDSVFATVVDADNYCRAQMKQEYEERKERAQNHLKNRFHDIRYDNDNDRDYDRWEANLKAEWLEKNPTFERYLKNTATSGYDYYRVEEYEIQYPNGRVEVWLGKDHYAPTT